MPKYSIPNIDSLCKSITQYADEYPKAKAQLNELKAVIALRTTLSPEDFAPSLLGYLVFMLEKPRQSSVTSLFYSEDRLKDEVILRWLDTSDKMPEKNTDYNYLDDKHRFTYLTAYYNNVVNPPKKAQSEEKKEVKSSVKELESVMGIVMKRLSFQMNYILKAKPSDNAILSEAKKLPKKYREKYGDKGTRESLMHFHEKLLSQIEKIEATQESKSDKMESKFNRSTVYGLLLYYMLLIEGECNSAWLPIYYPDGSWLQNGSELYKECQRILNSKCTADISHYAIKEQLSALHYAVSQIAGKEEELKKWHDEKFSAKSFFDELQDQLTIKMNELSNKSKNIQIDKKTNEALDYVSAYAVTYGVSYAVTKMIQASITNVLSATTVGTMFLTPEFAVVAILAILLQKAFQSNITSHLSSTIQPIVKQCATATVTIPYQATLAVYRYYLDVQPATETAEENPSFILALLSAPESVVAKNIKEKLVYLYLNDNVDFKALAKKQLTEEANEIAQSLINTSSVDLSKEIQETHLKFSK